MIDFVRHQRWFVAVVAGALVICVVLMLLRSKGVDIIDVASVFVGIFAIAAPIAWERWKTRRVDNSQTPRTPLPAGRRRLIIAAAWILPLLMLLALWSSSRQPDVRVADRLMPDGGDGKNMSAESTARFTLTPPFEPRENIFLQFTLTAPETVSKSGNCLNPSRLTINAIADGHVSGTATDVSSLEEVRLSVENASRLSVDVTYNAPTPECRVDLSVADAYLYNEFPP